MDLLLVRERQALLLVLTLFSILLTTHAHLQSCSKSFANSAKLTNCKKLTTLDAELAWSYQKDNVHNDILLTIVFGARLETDHGWVACGVNPKQDPQMIGTRAIVGLKHLNGSLTHNSYNITKYTKMGCHLLPSNITVVQKMEFSYVESTGYYTLVSTFNLPLGLYDKSKLNIVWQIGFRVEGEEPKMHPMTLQHVDSIETINLDTGITQTIGQYRTQLRTVHGIFNIIGWGMFLPIGVIIARNMKTSKEKSRLWFKLHVFCQMTSYTIGMTGWIIGLFLGNASKYYTFRAHRTLGILIFTFTTIQITSLIFKPNTITKRDKNWSMVHHMLGYSLVVLIIVNIFQGIQILKPDNHFWKLLYIAILVVLAVVWVSFELYTWTRFLCTKFFKVIKPEDGPQEVPDENSVQPKTGHGPREVPNDEHIQPKT